MKFLCDRCKTRYSIGDDRVRGKILKIRCKTCMNVITVREGMTADPDGLPPVAPEYAGRAKRSTTMAPDTHDALSERLSDGRIESVTAAPPEPAKPRSDARGSAPPRNTGPAAAKDNGTKPAAAAKPATGRLAMASPAPDLAAAKRAARTTSADDGRSKRTAAEPARDEPNALGAAFATAMAKPPAALEEEWYVAIDGDQAGPFSLVEAQGWVAQKPVDADLHCWSEGFDDWLPVDKVSHFRGLRQRSISQSGARVAAGASRASLSGSSSSAVDDGKPLFAATMASIERGPGSASPGGSTPPPPPRATPPFGLPAQPRASGTQSERSPAPPGKPAPSTRPGDTRPPAVFDTSEDGDPDGELEATHYRGLATALPPVANPALIGAVVTDAASDFESEAHAVGGDDLHIGEVSRVVKLADLAPRPRAERPGTVNRAATNPGAITRLPTNGGGYRHTSPGLNAVNGPSAGLPSGYIHSGADPDPSAIAPVVKAHRRGLIALLSVALVMVAGVIGAVALLVNTSDDPTGGGLGPLHNIDTSRPEDPITHRPIEPAPAAPVAPTGPRPVFKGPRPAGPAPVTAPEPPPANSLGYDEVEDMARKHSDMTKRCYMRSQKGTAQITVGDVKKIDVTLAVDRDGNVNELLLSDHATDVLGKCLTTSIKSWKFRASGGGKFRFSLNFAPS
jgi:predicted Zn finger-like uncharacterized protein